MLRDFTSHEGYAATVGKAKELDCWANKRMLSIQKERNKSSLSVTAVSSSVENVKKELNVDLYL